ncbi:MAG: hypothetical protein V7603_5162 [Micromonosporaceae bacterium]
MADASSLGGPGTGLAHVGYQGHTADSLVEALCDAGVTRVVDVRLNAVSRRPGFGKTALAASLQAAGIAYEHRPELGNPKRNRASFGGSAAEREKAHAAYRAVLASPAGRAGVDAVARAAARETVALLCVETDPECCHRADVFEAVWVRGTHLLRERLGGSGE